MQEMQERQDRRRSHVSLLAADRVGELLGVDRSTVYRMAADGRLPAVKVGRQWRFPADEVSELLQFGADEPASAALTPDPALIEPLLEVIAEALGVMMVVTDMHGRPITAVLNPCPAFAGRTGSALGDCVAEWRALAAGLDFEPRFRTGLLGFACARAFIRSGTELVGMVLAGGVAPDGAAGTGLYVLDERDQRRVLAALPKIAAALSRAAGHSDDPSSAGQAGGRP